MGVRRMRSSMVLSDGYTKWQDAVQDVTGERSEVRSTTFFQENVLSTSTSVIS